MNQLAHGRAQRCHLGFASRQVLADALGSTRALVDSQGAVSARYRYDAQGQLRESSGSQASQPFRYTGEFWEDGADAYHLRARDYLPELGRFNPRDSGLDRYQCADSSFDSLSESSGYG